MVLLYNESFDWNETTWTWTRNSFSNQCKASSQDVEIQNFEFKKSIDSSEIIMSISNSFWMHIRIATSTYTYWNLYLSIVWIQLEHELSFWRKLKYKVKIELRHEQKFFQLPNKKFFLCSWLTHWQFGQLVLQAKPNDCFLTGRLELLFDHVITPILNLSKPNSTTDL